MTTTEPRTAPVPVLTPDRLARLGAALSDAIAYREPDPGGCPDCAWSGTDEDEAAGELCANHQADLDQATSYAELARELGIEEQ